jgi:uncharacterized protein (DUF983 family)
MTHIAYVPPHTSDHGSNAPLWVVLIIWAIAMVVGVFLFVKVRQSRRRG